MTRWDYRVTSCTRGSCDIQPVICSSPPTHPLQGIYSDVAGPGMMVTQMTLAILGTWFWTLLYPLLILVSLKPCPHTVHHSAGRSPPATPNTLLIFTTFEHCMWLSDWLNLI